MEFGTSMVQMGLVITQDPTQKLHENHAIFVLYPVSPSHPPVPVSTLNGPPLIFVWDLVGPQAGGSVAQAEVAVAATTPGVVAAANFTDTNVSNIRKVIAAKLTESKTTVPHYYLTVNIELEKVQVRSRANFGVDGVLATN